MPRPAPGSYVVSVVLYNGTDCTTALSGGPFVATQKLYVTDCTPPADHPVPVDLNCLYLMEDFTTFCPALAGFGLTVGQNPTVGEDFPAGQAVPATVAVYDSLTLIGLYNFTLTTVDATAPTLTCPPDQQAPADATCLASVNPGQPTVSDNCIAPLVQGFRSDFPADLADPYPLGETTITWFAFDGVNASSCDQKITVFDTTPPTITTCPPDRDVITGLDGLADVPDMTGELVATDNCAIIGIGQDPLAGTKVALADSPVTVTMVAFDDALQFDTCDVTLTVLDGTPPVAGLCAGPFVNSVLSVGTPISDTSLIENGKFICATDNSGGPLTIEILAIDGTPVGSILEGDPRRPVGHPEPIVPLGIHNVVFIVTDPSANTTLLAPDVIMLQAVPMGCWDLNENGLGEPNEDRNNDGDYNADDCQGVACWDLNGNLTCDLPDEDANGDQVCDAKDCKGDKGDKGDSGFSCWDLNQNNLCDLPDEDINGDQVCDVKDCQAPPCWDLNGNLTCDLPDEDVNGDGVCDVNDCQGIPCWDLNGNLTCDLPDEDANGDGVCDVNDCQGVPCWDLNGNGLGDAGEDINGDGNYDAGDCQGVACWDLNGNLIGEPAEDRNGDGNYDALDCQGTACWDPNNNLTCDLPEEDANGDQVCDALDCRGDRGPTGATGSQGPQGETGLACWDLNSNDLGEPSEDINGDGNYNSLDCQGPAGETGPQGQEGAQGTPGEPGEQGATGAPAPTVPGCALFGAVELTLTLAGLMCLSLLPRRRYGR